MNQRQHAFVQEYLVSGNATQAAIKAGYSPKTAQEQGARLLSNVIVAEKIAQFRETMQDRTTVTIERVVLELTKLAFSDISDILEIEGNAIRIKNLSQIPKDAKAAISEITTTDTRFGEKRSIKMHSKLSALDALMRHLGGYVTIQDVIDKMDEPSLEKLTQKLLAQMKNKPAK